MQNLEESNNFFPMPSYFVNVPQNDWLSLNAAVVELAKAVKILASGKDIEYLTPLQACKVINVSRTTFDRYVRNGLIPIDRIDKGKKYSKVLVKRTDLDDLLSRGLV